MKRLVAAVLVLFLVASVSHADVIGLHGKTLDDLGTNVVAVDGLSPTVTPMHNGTVMSQAYKDDNDLYVYLYQIENTGPTAIELFTLWPFGGADSNTTDMGWLTSVDGVDNDFVIGDQVPEVQGYISDDEVISFYYTQRAGYAIAGGEFSAVMYVVSDWIPGYTGGNLIGGETGSGDVVAPVPEPATVLYLILGGLALLGFYRRR